MVVPFLATEAPCTEIHGFVKEEPMWWQLLQISRNVWQRWHDAGFFRPVLEWNSLNSAGCGISYVWQDLQNFAFGPPEPWQISHDSIDS